MKPGSLAPQPGSETMPAGFCVALEFGLADTAASGVISFDGWTLDPRERRLSRAGETPDIGDRAFDLLHVLAMAPGSIVATDALLRQVWPGRVVEENNLHVHVSTLRKLLGADAIRTVRGRGYQFTLRVAAGGAETSSAGDAAARRDAEPAAPETQPTSKPSRPQGNLPHHLAPLIGREDELQRLCALVQHNRTVTVIGPAGVGKTRLALATARGLAHQPGFAAQPGGAWLVELAGVADGAPIAEAVALALGLTLPGLQAADDELADVLRTRTLLLVLDNCEHRVREAGQLVDRLARGSSGVYLLATSQSPLKHRGEQLFRLGTLALPHPDAPASLARKVGAVALFCARVTAHDASFAIDDAQTQRLAEVVAICQRLDCLPLALELAAARVPLLGLAGVRQRLGQPLKLLGGGPAHAPMRQQTVRAAIEWSHALLGEDERRAFRRLGVFAGSFSLALAQQVLAGSADAAEADVDPDAQWPVLEMLHALLNKSLLVALPTAHAADPGTDDPPPRLRLLESTRAFAQEQLQASGERDAMSLQLAQAMLSLFNRGDGLRHYDTRGRDLRAGAAEIDNLREALDWLDTQPDHAQRHVELAGASAWIWSRLGLRAEGQRRCLQALQRVDAQTPPRLEARLQLAWVSLVHRRGAPGDFDAAARAAQLYQALGDRLGHFRALLMLASTHAFSGHEQEAMAAMEEMAEAFDPSWGLIEWAAYHLNLGIALAQVGRDEEAVSMIGPGIKHLQQVQDDEARANGWCEMARAYAALLGDYETALQTSQRTVVHARRAQLNGRLGIALGDMATTLVALGRVDDALPVMREALSLRTQDGTLGTLLDQLADLACARGRFEQAAMALGRADVHHAGRNGRRERYLLKPHGRALSALEEALPDADRQLAMARGAAMGDAEVARLTLGD